MRWRRSYACACVSPTSGSPDPKHQLCMGKGRLWDDPIATVCGIARQETVAQWKASGQYETGDMVLSIPQSSPMWDDAGQFDRLLLLNSTDVFSKPLVRGAPNERLLFNVVSFSRCYWLNPTNRNLVVEGGLPVVDATGVLSWPNGDGPPPGVTYSLSGTKFDEYYVWGNFPSDRNQHQGVRLPKRVVARKWDLFGR